jgi:hypothetical protein
MKEALRDGWLGGNIIQNTRLAKGKECKDVGVGIGQGIDKSVVCGGKYRTRNGVKR